ncbi:MAG TPA: hypothetical protein VGP07_18270 [Polyangia bacterium]
MRLIVLSLILVGTGAVLGAGCEPNGNYARLAQAPADVGGQGGAVDPSAGTGGLGDVGGSGVIVSSGGVTVVGTGGGGGKVSATGGAPGQQGGIGGQVSAAGGGGGHPSGAAGASGGTSGVVSGSGGTTGAGGRATSGSGGTVSGSGGTANGSGGVVGGTGGITSSGGSTGTPAGGAGGGATSAGGRGGASDQRMLSVDFVGGVAAGGAGGVSGTVVMAASEIAGVKPAKNWNSAAGPMGTLSTLALSDGSAATGAGVSWNAPIYTGSAGTYAIGYPDAPGDVRMMNGCLNPGWTGNRPTAPVTVVSFTGLPASITSGGYDVYVYVLGGIPGSETRLYTYTIGTVTFNVTQPGPTSTTPASPYAYTLAPDGGAGNYIVFRNVMGATFDLQVKPGGNSTTMRSPINGVQIVWPAGS